MRNREVITSLLKSVPSRGTTHFQFLPYVDTRLNEILLLGPGRIYLVLNGVCICSGYLGHSFDYRDIKPGVYLTVQVNNDSDKEIQTEIRVTADYELQVVK